MEVLPHSDKWKKVSRHDGGRRFVSLVWLEPWDVVGFLVCCVSSKAWCPVLDGCGSKKEGSVGAHSYHQ